MEHSQACIGPAPCGLPPQLLYKQDPGRSPQTCTNIMDTCVLTQFPSVHTEQSFQEHLGQDLTRVAAYSCCWWPAALEGHINPTCLLHQQVSLLTSLPAALLTLPWDPGYDCSSTPLVSHVLKLSSVPPQLSPEHGLRRQGIPPTCHCGVSPLLSHCVCLVQLGSYLPDRAQRRKWDPTPLQGLGFFPFLKNQIFFSHPLPKQQTLSNYDPMGKALLIYPRWPSCGPSLETFQPTVKPQLLTLEPDLWP